MTEPPMDDVSRLLQGASRGDRESFAALVTLLYRELSRLAHQRLLREGTGHTLGTTGLVHEAYLKLSAQASARWENREQFFAVASEAMRRVLVDHARRRLRDKRGGGAGHLRIDEAFDALPATAMTDDQSEDMVALDEALARLAAFNPEGARIVELHFFGGMSLSDIGSVMGTSERTVRRQWSVAKAWLRRELVPVLRAGGDFAGLVDPA